MQKKQKTPLGASVKLLSNMERHGILFVLPFEASGDKIANKIYYAATTDKPVLIHGPTGTGKELASHAIHLLSDRSKEPFMSINCVYLSKETFESKLFGHKKGAFTGAINDKKGFVEIADNGFVHLDEIGEISQEIQAKLLRLFENRTYYRMGEHQVRTTNTRFILTTLKPLERIRQDIIHRMGEKIYLPPIREYEGKTVYIGFLAQFISHDIYRKKFNKKPDIKIARGAIAELIFYDWPGNVRELEGLLRTAIEKVEKGLTQEQSIFMEGIGFKPPTAKAICTFGIHDKVDAFTYLPVEIYNQFVNLSDIISFDLLKSIHKLYNDSVKARVDPLAQLTDRLPQQKEQSSSLMDLLKGPNSQNKPFNPYEFFESYMDKENPLEELERDFLLNFLAHYNTQVSHSEAAKKLGLSGGEKFRRLMKKHNMKFISKSEWKKFYKM